MATGPRKTAREASEVESIVAAVESMDCVSDIWLPFSIDCASASVNDSTEAEEDWLENCCSSLFASSCGDASLTSDELPSMLLLLVTFSLRGLLFRSCVKAALAPEEVACVMTERRLEPFPLLSVHKLAPWTPCVGEFDDSSWMRSVSGATISEGACPMKVTPLIEPLTTKTGES